MASPPPPDLKPLEQRQREVDALIRSQVDPLTYEAVRESLKLDRLRLAIVAASLGRELWDRLWAVYRDGIELEAERVLTARETRPKDRGIFG